MANRAKTNNGKDSRHCGEHSSESINKEKSQIISCTVNLIVVAPRSRRGRTQSQNRVNEGNENEDANRPRAVYCVEPGAIQIN